MFLGSLIAAKVRKDLFILDSYCVLDSAQPGLGWDYITKHHSCMKVD